MLHLFATDLLTSCMLDTLNLILAYTITDQDVKSTCTRYSQSTVK